MAAEGIDHDARFVNREGNGLLAVDVLTGLCGHRRDDRMPSVPRGDQDGIDIRTRQDLAEVLGGHAALVVSTLGLGRVRGFDRVLCVIQAPFVDVAHGDHLKVRVADHPSKVPVAHDADADGRDSDPLAGGLQTDPRQYPRRGEQSSSLFQQRPAVDSILQPNTHRRFPSLRSLEGTRFALGLRMAKTVLHTMGNAHYSDAVSRLSRVGGISREKGLSASMGKGRVAFVPANLDRRHFIGA